MLHTCGGQKVALGILFNTLSLPPLGKLSLNLNGAHSFVLAESLPPTVLGYGQRHNARLVMWVPGSELRQVFVPCPLELMCLLFHVT